MFPCNVINDYEITLLKKCQFLHFFKKLITMLLVLCFLLPIDKLSLDVPTSCSPISKIKNGLMLLFQSFIYRLNFVLFSLYCNAYSYSNHVYLFPFLFSFFSSYNHLFFLTLCLFLSLLSLLSISSLKFLSLTSNFSFLQLLLYIFYNSSFTTLSMMLFLS